MPAETNPYPYDLPCSKVGCSELFKVYTTNYESTGLVQAMKFHMESVHCNVAPPPAGTKRKNVEDIDESCIPKIEKGLHEMSREEWRVLLDLWSWWSSLQPSHLDLTTLLMGRFPENQRQAGEYQQ